LYRWFRGHSIVQHTNRLQEIQCFAYFVMMCWKLPNVWLVFVLAPSRAIRRIYRKYLLRAGPARSEASSESTSQRKNAVPLSQ
jgi:hypothetical protein